MTTTFVWLCCSLGLCFAVYSMRKANKLELELERARAHEEQCRKNAEVSCAELLRQTLAMARALEGFAHAVRARRDERASALRHSTRLRVAFEVEPDETRGRATTGVGRLPRPPPPREQERRTLLPGWTSCDVCLRAACAECALVVPECMVAEHLGLGVCGDALRRRRGEDEHWAWTWPVQRHARAARLALGRRLPADVVDQLMAMAPAELVLRNVCCPVKTGPAFNYAPWPDTSPMHFAGFECCPWVGDAEALKRHLARHARDDPDRLPRAPPDAARKDYVIACPGCAAEMSLCRYEDAHREECLVRTRRTVPVLGDRSRRLAIGPVSRTHPLFAT